MSYKYVTKINDSEIENEISEDEIILPQQEMKRV